MITIYVLKCGNGKYYVGKTNKTAMKRYKEHAAGKGCAWTRKYKPTELVECFQGDNFDEDKKTKQYMDKYGIDNVRGGSYSQVKLDQASIESLKREMNGANDKCNICGKSGHFVRDCKYKNPKKNQKCHRCNRKGHTKEQCYATTKISSRCPCCNYDIDTRGNCRGKCSNKERRACR